MKTILAILNSCFFLLKNSKYIIIFGIVFWNAITLLTIALMSNPDIWLAFYLSFIPIGIDIISYLINKLFKKVKGDK